MGADMEPQVGNQLRSGFFRSLVRDVNIAIGRPMRRSEKLAIGFVVDRAWSGETEVEPFMKRVFDLDEGAQKGEVVSKIRTAIKQETDLEFERRVKSATSDHEERKLHEIKRLIDNGYLNTDAATKEGRIPVHLGAVPEYWTPDWVKEV